MLSYFANVYARAVTGLPIWGRHRWLQVFFAEKFLEAIDLNKVVSKRIRLQIEMSFRAWKKGLSHCRDSDRFVDRTEGQSKMVQGHRARGGLDGLALEMVGDDRASSDAPEVPSPQHLRGTR